MKENITSVLNEESDKTKKGIDEKLVELQKELLRLANSKAEYEDVADEIYRLRELKHSALIENAEREGLKKRIVEMTEFLDEQTREDEHLVRILIEKVTFFDEKFTVEFKSGVEIDEIL